MAECFAQAEAKEAINYRLRLELQESQRQLQRIKADNQRNIDQLRVRSESMAELERVFSTELEARQEQFAAEMAQQLALTTQELDAKKLEITRLEKFVEELEKKIGDLEMQPEVGPMAVGLIRSREIQVQQLADEVMSKEAQLLQISSRLITEQNLTKKREREERLSPPVNAQLLREKKREEDQLLREKKREEDLKKVIQDRDATIKQLRVEISDARIARLKAPPKDQQEIVADLIKVLAVRDSEIKALRSEVRSRERDIILNLKHQNAVSADLALVHNTSGHDEDRRSISRASSRSSLLLVPKNDIESIERKMMGMPHEFDNSNDMPSADVVSTAPSRPDSALSMASNKSRLSIARRSGKQVESSRSQDEQSGLNASALASLALAQSLPSRYTLSRPGSVASRASGNRLALPSEPDPLSATAPSEGAEGKANVMPLHAEPRFQPPGSSTPLATDSKAGGREEDGIRAPQSVTLVSGVGRTMISCVVRETLCSEGIRFLAEKFGLD